jgi:hypothetical protein
MADQAKATGKAPEAKPQAEQKPAKVEYKRTQVKTRNPRPGVYRTLNQSWEIERVDGSKKWSVFQLGKTPDGKGPTGERDLAIQDAGTWDEALTAIVEKLGQPVEELNREPAKPKPAAPAKAKTEGPTEAPEEGVSERRSGATGKPPRKTRSATETIHTRRTRAQKVG